MDWLEYLHVFVFFWCCLGGVGGEAVPSPVLRLG